MKVRIGISLGDFLSGEQNPEALLDLIDDCERWDIDSIWVSDRIVAPRPTLDPVVFMAYMASRLRNMKFGASALVPEACAAVSGARAMQTRAKRSSSPWTSTRTRSSDLKASDRTLQASAAMVAAGFFRRMTRARIRANASRSSGSSCRFVLKSTTQRSGVRSRS